MKRLYVNKETKADTFFNEWYKICREVEFCDDSVLIFTEGTRLDINFGDISEGIIQACQNSFIIDFDGSKPYIYINKNIESLKCVLIPSMIFKRLSKKPITQLILENKMIDYSNPEMLIKKIINLIATKSARFLHYPSCILKEEE